MNQINEHLDADDFSKICQDLEEMHEVPRDKTIKIEILSKNHDIVLEREDGEKMPLSSLLPRNSVFAINFHDRVNFCCDIEWELKWVGPVRIKYPRGALDKAYFLIVLLHEIGHAWDQKWRLEEKSSYEESITMIGNIKNFTESTKAIIFKLITKSPGWYISRKNLEKTRRQERFAWNFALRKYRELKREWWDVSGWLSDEQIQNIVRCALLRYEMYNEYKFPWEKYTKMTNRKRLKLK